MKDDKKYKFLHQKKFNTTNRTRLAMQYIDWNYTLFSVFQVIVGDPDVIIVDDDNINQDVILNEPAQQCEVEVVQLSSGGEEETHADAGKNFHP